MSREQRVQGELLQQVLVLVLRTAPDRGEMQGVKEAKANIRDCKPWPRGT